MDTKLLVVLRENISGISCILLVLISVFNQCQLVYFISVN